MAGITQDTHTEDDINAGMKRTERMPGIKQETHREDDRNQAGHAQRG